MLIRSFSSEEISIRSVKVKGAGVVNHQFVNLHHPGRAASVNERPDGHLNVVDRLWNELYDGDDGMAAAQAVIKILDL